MIIAAALSKTTMLVTKNMATAASQVILVTAVSPKGMLAVSQTTSKTASSSETGTSATPQRLKANAVPIQIVILMSQSRELGKISLTPVTST
jgi:hypothetical protein